MTKWQAIWQVIKGGGWVQVLGTLVTIATTVGVLNAVQANAIVQLGAGVASLLGLIASVVTTFQHAKVVKLAAELRSAIAARDVAGA